VLKLFNGVVIRVAVNCENPPTETVVSTFGFAVLIGIGAVGTAPSAAGLLSNEASRPSLLDTLLDTASACGPCAHPFALHNITNTPGKTTERRSADNETIGTRSPQSPTKRKAIVGVSGIKTRKAAKPAHIAAAIWKARSHSIRRSLHRYVIPPTTKLFHLIPLLRSTR
jgi:hypothetical protein